MKNVLIHRAALVEANDIGDGTRIWAFTHIMEGAHVGRHCNIGDHCFIETGAFVGDNVTIKNGNMIWEGVTLEDGVFVGPHVFFTNDLYPRSQRLPQARERYSRRENWLVQTVIRNGASLGSGALILAGAAVGEFAMVGASAVVTRDVPAYALVKGSPAKVSGWVCQCGRPLRFFNEWATCGGCNLRFRKDDDGVRLVDGQEMADL